MEHYYVGECPICKNYGRMEVLFNFSSNKCSIMCDECTLEFDDLYDFLKNQNGYRKTYEKAEARTATLDEIKNSEWFPYLK